MTETTGRKRLPDPDVVKIAKKMNRALKFLGITQLDLATAARISKAYVSNALKYPDGKTSGGHDAARKPNLEMVLGFIRITGSSVTAKRRFIDWLLFEDVAAEMPGIVLEGGGLYTVAEPPSAPPVPAELLSCKTGKACEFASFCTKTARECHELKDIPMPPPQIDSQELEKLREKVAEVERLRDQVAAQQEQMTALKQRVDTLELVVRRRLGAA